MPRSADLSEPPAGGARVSVAAGILADSAGRVLICERTGDGPFAGLWEFPGGKLEPGESASAALARELDEELGITLDDCRHFMRVDHDYERLRVGIDFYLVRRWHGTPTGRDGQRLDWRRPTDVVASELLPANAPVLAALRRLPAAR